MMEFEDFLRATGNQIEQLDDEPGFGNEERYTELVSYAVEKFKASLKGKSRLICNMILELKNQ